jgi:hypothetical protein
MGRKDKQSKSIKSAAIPVVEVKKSLNTQTFQEKGKLIISKELQAEIMYLHSKISDVEWSGVLLFKVISGGIDDIENLVIKAHHVFPQDVGTSGYTEYKFDEDTIDMYDEIPGAEDMKIGHIHSHHNMQTFFSATDTSELEDNAPNHNYYLSLIVNHKSQPCAKIAFISESTETITYRGPNGKKKKVTYAPEPSLSIIDMDIVFESVDTFRERVNKLIIARNEITSKARVITTSPYANYGGYGGNSQFGRYADVPQRGRFHDWDTYDDDKKASQPTKQLQLNVFGQTKTLLSGMSDFLPKLVALDLNYKGTVGEFFRTADKLDEAEMELYVAMVDDSAVEYFEKFFKFYPTDEEISRVSLALLKVLDILPDNVMKAEFQKVFELNLAQDDEKEYDEFKNIQKHSSL